MFPYNTVCLNSLPKMVIIICIENIDEDGPESYNCQEIEDSERLKLRLYRHGTTKKFPLTIIEFRPNCKKNHKLLGKIHIVNTGQKIITPLTEKNAPRDIYLDLNFRVPITHHKAILNIELNDVSKSSEVPCRSSKDFI